jgi:hypothetical protein
MRPPKIIKPYVISFCRGFVADPHPVYVPVLPLKKVSANDCFNIVPQHVAANGGEQVTGWAIWEWPRVLIEAEFHCVWRKEDGTLIDISPKTVRMPRIVFVIDPVRSYTGRQVNNIRRPLDRDPAIKRFCDLSTRLHNALNEGDLAYFHGEVELSEAATRDELERRELQKRIQQKYGANSPEPMSLTG